MIQRTTVDSTRSSEVLLPWDGFQQETTRVSAIRDTNSTTLLGNIAIAESLDPKSIERFIRQEHPRHIFDSRYDAEELLQIN